jgi:hypothetical protein
MKVAIRQLYQRIPSVSTPENCQRRLFGASNVLIHRQSSIPRWRRRQGYREQSTATSTTYWWILVVWWKTISGGQKFTQASLFSLLQIDGTKRIGLCDGATVTVVESVLSLRLTHVDLRDRMFTEQRAPATSSPTGAYRGRSEHLKFIGTRNDRRRAVGLFAWRERNPFSFPPT